MIKRVCTLLLFSLLLMNAKGNQIPQDHESIKNKEIDNGGTGLFKAIAVSEKSLPNYVVYRPKDLSCAAFHGQKLPVLIWANGGCMDTSVGYERMLIEIASHGYVVVAIGDMMQALGDRKEVHTPSSMVLDAMNWICNQAGDKTSIYYNCVDAAKIGAAGHSCGGAQVLCNAANPRLKTYLICNAGMGDMEMAGADVKSLNNLHAPIIYLTGGKEDVAYQNAQLDYERISHVPVVLADLPTAGHQGTYSRVGGGDFGKMIILWLDWQLKGKSDLHSIFEYGNLANFPGWTMKRKNFGSQVSELIIKNGKRNIYGVLSVPVKQDKRKVAIVSHGFNGTHHFAIDYYDTLLALGYMVYGFDYPCGSINSRSDSNTVNMSIIDQKKDLESVVAYFENRPDVDTKNIVLIGESQGGFISALAAADLKERISNLVLIYPALCIPDNWNSRYPNIEDIPDTTKLWNIPLGKRFFVELRNMDVYKTIATYKGPVQIIHGSKDPIVPLSYAEKAMKLYSQAHLVVIPGAGHGFKPSERAVSNKAVEEFLNHN